MFDGGESERLKQDGMDRAAANRKARLAVAREIARKLAKSRESRMITADDVGRYMKDNNLGELGPAAGSLFKTPDWEMTDERRKSKRVSNHSRELRVWRLKD